MTQNIEGLKNKFLYILYLLFIIIITDTVLFKHILGFGYPSHYEQENILRYPSPYVEFTGKPNVRDHNILGYKGKSFYDADSGAVKVAFLGGSTGYNGDPTISETIEKELKERWNENIFIANYSVVSSNHRQHLHMIVENVLLFKPDIIVFYGGNNETANYIHYDPRPGYPYNYFFRGELSSLRQILLKNSALLGELDKRFGIVSGLNKLRLEQNVSSKEWNTMVADKYLETIQLANMISKSSKSSLFEDCLFFAFYQPFQVPESFVTTHNHIRQQIMDIPYIHDVSAIYDQLGEAENVFIDEVHVQQPARNLMGKTIANLIIEKLDKIENQTN
jgi:hypothetical protein